MADGLSSLTHIPVLLDEVIAALSPREGGLFIDGTLGAGGHTEAILARGGSVLGFDRDEAALALVGERLSSHGSALHLVHASYAQMAYFAESEGFSEVDGILLDLGYSSLQVDDPARGFSFRDDGPLDMRFDQRGGLTAADILNTWDEEEIADIIFRYGEDHFSRRIARAIVAARPLGSTKVLAEIVSRAIPGGHREKIHPATRTFQALRIAVNDELAQLEAALPVAIDLLRPGGRLAVISFHSLEDRIVKNTLRTEASDCICPPEQPICTCDHEARIRLITRKPIVASESETARNPRSRSARLRVGEKR